MEWPSLRVELVVASSLGHRNGMLICIALCVVDVAVLTSGAFLIGLAIPRRAVDANVEDHATPERWERGLLGEGFDEGLRGALGFRVRIFIQDGLEGCSGTSTGVQHVNRRWKLVSE